MPSRVRRAAADVAARARHVTIDDDAVGRVAETLPLDRVGAPALEPGDLPDLGEAGTVAWVLTVNAVNFGSGFFPVLAKRPGLSGSKTVFAALRERFDRVGAFTAEELRTATPERCAALFGQDPDGPAAELMAWFSTAWSDLGTALVDRFEGSFEALAAAGDGSAAALAEVLSGVPGWADTWVHDGRPVPLFKRAQIVPAHLAMAFGGTGPGRFHDLDDLTIFADNLVPHVLRLDGVLRFDDGLVGRIDAEELLEPGSPEEVEIRAVAVDAAERIVAHLRSSGHPATAMGLDQVLWNRGGGATYKARPRHRSRSTAY
ncbi:MAG: hypothetical protein KF906_00850 [Actinobacteria bacterium]|nr:hypothetical protein [Actinomycetota bacterium]